MRSILRVKNRIAFRINYNKFTKFYDNFSYNLLLQSKIRYTVPAVVLYTFVDITRSTRRNSGKDWCGRGRAVAGVEMGFGTRERWPMPFYAYRMHTHPF